MEETMEKEAGQRKTMERVRKQQQRLNSIWL